MTNSSVQLALQADTVPLDLNCPRDGQGIVDLVAQCVKITGLASATSGENFNSPATNSVAQQALELAQSVQTQLTSLQATLPQRRYPADGAPVATGDSITTLTWSPAMPSTDYTVSLTLFGPNTHPGAYYGWRAVAGTQSTTSVQIVFDNIPANTVFSAVIEQIIPPS